MKFFVELDQSRKKISCESLSQLKQVIENKFSISLDNYLVQQFDTDEQLFFDVDDEGDLEDGSRIKLVQKQVLLPFPAASSTLSAEDTTISKMNEDEENESDESSSIVKDQDERINEVPQKKERQINDQTVQEDNRPPWPLVFKIPEKNLGVSLKAKLDNTQSLNANMRKQLFCCIYDEATKYFNGNYPSRSQYVLMTNALLGTYPHLLGGASLSDSMCYWKTKLNDHFRNNRKRNDRDSPYVKEKMQRYSKSRKTSSIAESYVDKSKNIWGIKNFLPQRCAGEDDESIQQHMKLLDQQGKLVENLRNKAVVSISMDKTFPERRNFILEEGIKTIDQIKIQYPLLFTYHQVMAEFKRLTGLDLIESFSQGVHTYSTQLVNLKPFKTEFALLRSLREKIKTVKLQSKKEYYQSCCALAIITQQLREQTADLFIYERDAEDEISSFPKILLEREPLEENSHYRVMVEGVIVCSCEDLVSAYASLFACYYIFNLSYPDKLKSTLNFFQRVIFNFQDGSKKDPKISRLVTTLLMK